MAMAEEGNTPTLSAAVGSMGEEGEAAWNRDKIFFCSSCYFTMSSKSCISVSYSSCS